MMKEIFMINQLSKVTTGKGDHYATGRWLHYRYFKDHYQLIACDLSKQKELDADPRSLQQIQFYCMLSTNSHKYLQF